MSSSVRTLIAIVTGALALTLGVVTPSFAATVTAPAAAPGDEAVRTYLDRVREDLDLPGLAVLTTGPNGSATYLLGTDGNGRAIDENSRFLTGSVAKSMTATIVMLLESDGRLKLSDPASRYLPETTAGRATIRDLLTHRSGFTAADGLAVTERFNDSTTALRHAVTDLTRSGVAGEYAYSSANYLVLGAIIESVTGMPFAQAAHDLLFAPLGMTATTADPKESRLPPGHQSWFGFPRAHEARIDVGGAPAGYVATTLHDLQRYLAAQQGKRPDVLSEDLLTPMHERQVKASDDSYGYGWRVRGTGSVTVVHHTGATPGYFAHLLMAQDGRGVIVLANLYDESRAAALSRIGDDVLTLTGPNPPSAAPEPGARDTLLATAPWIGAVLALVGIVLAVALLRRRGNTRSRITLTVVGALLAIALYLAPGLLGTDWRGVAIWAPDVRWALTAAIAAWVLAAAAAASCVVRHREPTGPLSLTSRYGGS